MWPKVDDIHAACFRAVATINDRASVALDLCGLYLIYHITPVWDTTPAEVVYIASLAHRLIVGWLASPLSLVGYTLVVLVGFRAYVFIRIIAHGLLAFLARPAEEAERAPDASPPRPRTHRRRDIFAVRIVSRFDIILH